MNSKTVEVKVPGKLMLFGEHAVIYGYPCIVTAVNKYISVKVNKISGDNDVLITPESKDVRFVSRAIEEFRNKYFIKDKIMLKTKSQLGKYGLGTSAAVTVATIEALAKLCGISLTPNELFTLSYQVVLDVQKAASGFDVAASIFGGTILFNGKNKVAEQITSKTLPLVVAFSGTKASTVSMIKKVNDLRKRNPRLVEDIFIKIDQIVKKAKKAILKKDWIDLGKLMNENHQYLIKLGVSNQKLDNLVLAANHAGAYGAKLSGAGGGDCIIILVSSEKKNNVIKHIQESKGEIIDIL